MTTMIYVAVVAGLMLFGGVTPADAQNCRATLAGELKCNDHADGEMLRSMQRLLGGNDLMMGLEALTNPSMMRALSLKPCPPGVRRSDCLSPEEVEEVKRRLPKESDAAIGLAYAGRPYDAARAGLIARGYRPSTKRDPDACAFGYEHVCARYAETASCGYSIGCEFEFVKGGETVRLLAGEQRHGYFVVSHARVVR